MARTTTFESVETTFGEAVSTSFSVNPAEYSRNWGIERIDAAEAWEFGTGEGVVVAVLDTGVDYDHRDLDANMWFNAGEIAGDGIDNDGNGFIDDVNGWNFTSSGPSNSINDVHSHGTHVAGIIAAEANGEGTVGVAPDAEIMGVKVLGDSGFGSWTGIAQGIDYAIENGAQIINLSLGGRSVSNAIVNAVERAQEAGVIVVAAAGNSGGNQALNPAALAEQFDNVISVANSTTNDNLNSRSNYSEDGTTVDLAAPGTGIRSTTPDDGFGSKTGTSMAAPMVAGAAAALWSAAPNLSYRDIIDAIESTVDKVLTSEKLVGTDGILNLAEAMKMVVGLDRPEPPVNEAPTLDIDVAVDEIDEDAADPSSVLLAELTVNDDGVGVTMMTLSGGDVDAFEIRDGALYLREGVTLDFETKSTYTVEISVDDAELGDGVEDTVTYSLSVGDVDETPVTPPEEESPQDPEADPSEFDFNAVEMVDFQKNRQDKGDHTVSEDGDTLFLESQSWEAVLKDVTVTEATVLSFDFSADVQGEIHGVMFTNGNKLSKDTAFQLYGTQNWGIDTYRSYDTSGETVRFDIAVGEHFTGDFDRIVFFTDDDRNVGADSTFANVALSSTLDDAPLPAPNTGPVAADDGPFDAVASAATSLLISDLLANDSDADGDALVMTSILSSSGGTAALDGDSFVFTADAAGSASVVYEISDGRGGVDQATVFFNVAAAPIPNPAPEPDPAPETTSWIGLANEIGEGTTLLSVSENVGKYSKSGTGNFVGRIDEFVFGDIGAPDGFDTHGLNIIEREDEFIVRTSGAGTGGSASAKFGANGSVTTAEAREDAVDFFLQAHAILDTGDLATLADFFTL